MLWADELRYLELSFLRSLVFKCSLSHAKKLFYRLANARFGQIGRTASGSFATYRVPPRTLITPLPAKSCGS